MKSTLLLVLTLIMIGANVYWWFRVSKRLENWLFGSLLSRALGVRLVRQPQFRSHVWRIDPLDKDRARAGAQALVTFVHIIYPVLAALPSLISILILVAAMSWLAG
ncbi:MAG TPA: hypothetical protein VD886_20430 [Herpetosiphonaceae bacterium]|nr:hypothetical protein [Herpetosiphonaceae bacterium]